PVQKSAWWWMQSGSNRSPPRNSLLAGKRTGNFAESGPPEAIFAHSRTANSVPCSRIPYAMEQGIFWKDGLHPRETDRPVTGTGWALEGRLCPPTEFSQPLSRVRL